jgi:D-alanine-D-alanine ligase
MKGFSRTEFIIVDNEPFMLEMNTVWRQKVLPQQSIAFRLKICLNAIELALVKFH